MHLGINFFWILGYSSTYLLFHSYELARAHTSAKKLVAGFLMQCWYRAVQHNDLQARGYTEGVKSSDRRRSLSWLWKQWYCASGSVVLQPRQWNCKSFYAMVGSLALISVKEQFGLFKALELRHQKYVLLYTGNLLLRTHSSFRA